MEGGGFSKTQAVVLEFASPEDGIAKNRNHIVLASTILFTSVRTIG